MFDYDFLRIVEIWLASYAALMQLVCLFVTWERVTLGEAWRYVFAALFLAAFVFGTLQVVHQHVPPGTRIFYLTAPLVGIDVGLTYTFIQGIRRLLVTRKRTT